MVAAFEDAGLEVGQSYPLEQEPGYKNSPLPKAYEEGTRFEIPSMGKNEGGRVFVFENREDLAVVHHYYKEMENMPLFGPSLHSHLYDDGQCSCKLTASCQNRMQTATARYSKKRPSNSLERIP